ncbi:MAG: exodeoxyribonuclease VII large subunit [Acidobacteria bacterium RIFCSPLOWO2_12_FULL_67_14]|nr:MAG: exodeoxyribonuclease VII large subunit [Acidobacteria bacterium RIFCSPLOWO2_02_FULL_67_21]OFW37319.1 MAG: exodeoxyribonuclease VII large subunit [Acidobacteria bacterium RIFCSPLOWO2_12_FULL_67_14]
MLAPEAAVPARRRVLTVSELTGRIRALLEERLADVWVEGELSNCRVWNTGHMYFTLKDSGAQIKGVMFRSAVRSLRFAPQDGLRVVARGRISVYDPKGEYQIVCDRLDPEGLGALQLAFDQLKQRLAAEGLFDAGRKRPLPALPRKIGVVTSLDGAAVRDIIKVLQRRYPNAHIVIRPTRVQGDGAAGEIARALSAIVRVPAIDVVIVGRGGGSIEDLWAFNEETVARAIAGCPVPTISAVGHETDVTIADFVADVRAPTPSAAAEMVVARKDEFCSRIDRLTHRVGAAMRGRLHRVESRLRAAEARPGYAGMRGHVALRARHVADLVHDVSRAARARLAARMRVYQAARLALESLDLRRRLGRVRARLVDAQGRLAGAATRRRHGADSRLRTAAARLDAMSPLAVLGRGYAVCWNADRTAIIRDAAVVAAGERVQVTLAHGELECEVKNSRR